MLVMPYTTAGAWSSPPENVHETGTMWKTVIEQNLCLSLPIEHLAFRLLINFTNLQDNFTSTQRAHQPTIVLMMPAFDTTTSSPQPLNTQETPPQTHRHYVPHSHCLKANLSGHPRLVVTYGQIKSKGLTLSLSLTKV